jgi:hypothetical protein
VSLLSQRIVRMLIVLAIACGCLYPTSALAQNAPAKKKVFKRPAKFRKMAADVMTTIPVNRNAKECYTKMPMPDLSLVVKADIKLQAVPKVGPVTATLRTKVDEVTYRRAIWNLEFTFKPLRMIRVDMPQPSGKMRNKLIWYMVYKVRNPGQHFVPVPGEQGRHELVRADAIGANSPGVRFVPFFVLQENRETNRFFREKIIPLAMPKIMRREFRAGEFKTPEVFNTAQMSQRPLKAGEQRWGVVTWENIDPKIDFLSIYIQGLSNAYKWTESRQQYAHGDPAAVGRKLTRKTLKLNFWRPGDEFLENEQEIIYGIPAEYTRPKAAPGADDDEQFNPGWLDHKWMYR